MDGTSIHAVKGLKQSTNAELSGKKLAYSKAQLELIEQYLQGMDEADTIDQGRMNKAFALDIDPNHLPR